MRVPTTSRTMSTRTTMATVVRLTPSRVRGKNSSVREGNVTVVCRFSRLCCPAGEPATRLSRESRQMEVKVDILLIKKMSVEARVTGSLVHLYVGGRLRNY